MGHPARKIVPHPRRDPGCGQRLDARPPRDGGREDGRSVRVARAGEGRAGRAARRGREEVLPMEEAAVPRREVAPRGAREGPLALGDERQEHGLDVRLVEERVQVLARPGEERLSRREVHDHATSARERRRKKVDAASVGSPRVRRGLERYAPRTGYDPGPHARSKLAQIVVTKAGLFPGDWVLDVETDAGLLGVQVGRAFTRAKVVATDADRDRLLRAAENARAEGCDARMRLVQCAPDALPFKDERFFFSTLGLAVHEVEEPLDVLDEIHRTTGFSGKVYVATVDLRKARRKPKGVRPWVFDDETLGGMREIGFGKVQLGRVAVLADGARLHLVMAKRFDAEDAGEEAEDEEDDDDE